MTIQMTMGNAAAAFGAINAGVRVVAGYPGTPSSELLETIARVNAEELGGAIHVEWSTNEKAALELAAGAAISGSRAIVTMKQVGLNVASDPLMSLAYIGVAAGMVVFVADDPGPISSQTEQDTRTFAGFAKLPIFDPSSPEELYEMMGDAFKLSETCGMPVIVRSTTRVSHSSAPLGVELDWNASAPSGFKPNPKWVIFPKRAYEAHGEINQKLQLIKGIFDSYAGNFVEGVAGGMEVAGVAGGMEVEGVAEIADVKDVAGSAGAVAENGAAAAAPLGIVTGGISYLYVKEALESEAVQSADVLRIATPHPFPQELARKFLASHERVVVFEELDPVIERALLQIAGKQHLNLEILGKLTEHVPARGELGVDIIEEILKNIAEPERPAHLEQPPVIAASQDLPARPPTLCAGCPHRSSFYAIKKAVGKKKAYHSGDIGCYTLGNAAPLHMVDTCLCMGAGITMAQGMHISEPDALNFAYVGDSTFFASGITGAINAIYNQHNIILIVLDNSTTAMTGNQPHPGTGIRMTKPTTDDTANAISIPRVLEAIGFSHIEECNPHNITNSIEVVKTAIKHSYSGKPSAIIFKAPCITLFKKNVATMVDSEKCTACNKCVMELGCPAMQLQDKLMRIDESLCYGCAACVFTCPFSALFAEGTGA